MYVDSHVHLSHRLYDGQFPCLTREQGEWRRLPEETREGLVEALREAGVSLFAAHLRGKASYDKMDYKKACGFLIGNEGNGLSDELADLADAYVRIPMEGKVESLNAAIAASLLVYEVHRQRQD